MKEIPMLFSDSMIRAIIDGRKTQTRRIVNVAPLEGSLDGYGPEAMEAVIRSHSPWQVGDTIYVRECWLQSPGGEYCYRADGHVYHGWKWRPSIHMPREACRLFLDVTRVRCERIQSIHWSDIRAEGIDCPVHDFPGGFCCSECPDLRGAFRGLWDSLYSAPQPIKQRGAIVGYRSFPWDGKPETRQYTGLPWYVIPNPWVFPIDFTRKD